ncbi:MAG: tyrosine-type recombinase/integrase [Desulfurococcaceae archaeon]
MAKARKKGKVSYGDNLYEIHGSYWLKFTYKGKTYYERIGRVDEMPLTMARNIAIKIKQEIIQGTYLPVKEKGLTFKELAQEYLKWYETHHHNTKESTKRKHKHVVQKLVEVFGSLPANNITTLRIESYKQERLKEGVSPKTINNELATLRAILRKAKELGLIHFDLPKISLLKVSNERVRYLLPEEVDRLISNLPDWLKPMVEFALYTGLRAGELTSLKWDMVDFASSSLQLPASLSKNKETARIPLNSRAIEILKEIKEKQEKSGIGHGYVFTNSKGEPYSEGGYRKAFNNALRKSNIVDFRFHDLRHTFASWLAMKGVDLYTIQHLTRHKSTNMVKRYAHLSPEHLREAVKKLEDIPKVIPFPNAKENS